jgi:hypothetical protein
MRFHTTLGLGGKTATGFEVPAEVVEALGSGRRPPVQVTIGPYTYRTTVAPMGGRYLIPVSAEHRTAAGLAAGDELDVELALDTAPRTVELPPDLAAALDAAPDARRFYDGLAYSQRKEYARWVDSAKRPETRERRLAQAVALLTAGRKQH